jgi:deoxyribodipyrimidine photolyase
MKKFITKLSHYLPAGNISAKDNTPIYNTVKASKQVGFKYPKKMLKWQHQKNI